MKLTLSQDWTFATGINPEKGFYKCQGRRLQVSDVRMFQNKYYTVKVPAGTYDVALTNHNGEVWVVLVNAGSRRRKNIAVGAVLSVLREYKSHGVTLTNDDGSPHSVNFDVASELDEARPLVWANKQNNENPPIRLHDFGSRRGTNVKLHAWFSKKHADLTAPALYASEVGEPLLVTSCSENYEESKPSRVNPAFDDGIYRGTVTRYIGTERDYKSHTDYLWNLKQ